MSAWRMKLFLGSLALLAWPWLGGGGRAGAGFTPGQLVLVSDNDTNTFTFGLRPALTRDQRHDVTLGMGSEAAPPPGRPNSPWLPDRDHKPGGPEAAEGMSSQPPSGSSGGGGQFAALPENAAPEGAATGRLFLLVKRYKAPPFASRLFRPPRVVA